MRWRQFLLREVIHLALVVGWIVLLHRTVSDADVNFWVGSGLDLLSIQVAIAGSPEYQAIG